MFLKILAHPVFANLNFHMPMIVDLSHPLVMLTGESNTSSSGGSGGHALLAVAVDAAKLPSMSAWICALIVAIAQGEQFSARS